MADINKIIQVQQAIDTLTSGENSLEKLGISSLTNQVGSVADSLDIQKIASAQLQVQQILGSSLDLGGIANIADCVKNIDDLLMEKVKQKAVDTITQNPNAAALIQNLDKMSQMAKAGAQLMDNVKALKEKSLTELLVDAKNAGFLDKIPIIKQITDKYGSVVSDINGMISKLSSLDVCSMINYKNGIALPKAAKVNTGIPTDLPAFNPSVTMNESAVNAQQSYNDALFRIGELVGDKTGLEPSGPNNAMLIELQYFSRAMVNKLGESDDPQAVKAELETEVQRKIDSNKGQWPSATIAEYQKRANECIGLGMKESTPIRNYIKLKTMGENSSGQLGAYGVTIYGGPEWDFTTFLDVRPSERPPELTSYWQGRGYNIAKQEAKLKARGIKTGTLSLSDCYTGAYGGKLKAGFSCASTRYPGGSQLQLKNADGTIYDPAGINPSGIVTVDDTGNAELTFKKVDLFIAREHVEAYKKTNMAGVQVFLVSMGTKTGRQYKLAQSKYGNGNMA